MMRFLYYNPFFPHLKVMMGVKKFWCCLIKMSASLSENSVKFFCNLSKKDLLMLETA